MESINARNAGYAGRKLGEANSQIISLRIIWRDFLGAILRPLVTLESTSLKPPTTQFTGAEKTQNIVSLPGSSASR
jgi:hypothetical protein